jgi:transcriptional regulator with XRE-family HTH domain
MHMEKVCADPISKRELLAYQADLKGSIFRQIRQIFHRMKQHGVTQKTLARRIGIDEGQLSRRLRGDYDLRLETLSDLSRGLECRIDVKLTPLADVGLTIEAQDAKSEASGHPLVIGGTSKWEKYHEIRRSEMLKERPVKEPNNVAIEPAKTSAFKGRIYAKDWRTLSNKRGFVRRFFPRRQVSSLWLKKPSGSAKSYAFWKMVGGHNE